MIQTHLNDVVLAISSFQSDVSVLNLLDRVFSVSHSFLRVIVVDSLSNGSLETEISRRGYDVLYFNSPLNLGSAGNLRRRLELAIEHLNATWCFCINDDGYFDLEFVHSLVSSAKAINDKVGAVFPNRVYINKSSNPVFKVENTVQKLDWNSSNGCLYSLEPVRDGLLVNSSLWMGWEDLIYCLYIQEHGYQNYVSQGSIYYDSYEYKKISLLVKTFHISDKASWYSYYAARNLIIGIQSLKHSRKHWPFVFFLILKNSVLSLAFRSDKWLRLKLTLKGIIHGFKNKSGFIGIGSKK